jgi:hypothetical protein
MDMKKFLGLLWTATKLSGARYYKTSLAQDNHTNDHYEAILTEACCRFIRWRIRSDFGSTSIIPIRLIVRRLRFLRALTVKTSAIDCRLK